MTRQLQWFNDRGHVVALACYMADMGETAHEVVYMLEKPWQYEDEFKAMSKAQDDERRFFTPDRPIRKRQVTITT